MNRKTLKTNLERKKSHLQMKVNQDYAQIKDKEQQSVVEPVFSTFGGQNVYKVVSFQQ